MKRNIYILLMLCLVFVVNFLCLQKVDATTAANRMQTNAQKQKTYEFINGQWFDGKKFRHQIFYSVNGTLMLNKPQAIDETIDLVGGYVIPPFADAHTHHFDGAYQTPQQIEMYLREGVFYAKVVTNTFTGAKAVAAMVNKPVSVDVAYSHGGLTANFSHPIEIYEALALGFYDRKQQQENVDKIWASRLRENDAYYLIDTADDIERKWSRILANKPDFIKVYLWHSEGYAERLNKTGRGGGVDPKLLPEIVAKAHAAGLRVTAAVNTAYDFHVALRAGADEMSHLPGYFIAENEDIQKYKISSEDAKLAAKREVVVTITGSAFTANVTAERAQPIRDNQIRNLRLLKKYDVKFAVGSDSYGKTPFVEATYLKDLGVFSNLDLLKTWVENTSQAIFPNRKIGHLRDGYEASFLVLGGNPLENFEQVKNIRLRFKEGNSIGIDK